MCNESKLFIDVFVGIPGSCHDARLYQLSNLSQRIENHSVVFPNDTHIIGDLAYTLNTKLMVGFKDFGNLTPRQINFNNRLARIRVIIEQTFALLKGRFRRLKFMEASRLDVICLNVVVACIFHNICLLNGDFLEDIDIEHEVDEERMGQGQENNGLIYQEQNRMQAVIKRNRIAANLPL